MRFNRTNLALMLVMFMSALTFTSFANAAQQGADKHTASFAGAKANTGTVTHSKQGNKNILTLSDDFVVPETPDPHVQVVDSKGNTYLLDRLKIKGDKTNRVITLPAYVKDVQKVVIWCAFAEANLGEADFKTALK